MLDKIEFESQIRIEGVPVQWIPMLQLYDPDLPQHPVKYVHIMSNKRRVFGFPAYLNVEETGSSMINLKVLFLCNVDLDSKKKTKDIVKSELEERFGVSRKVDLATLKNCCGDRKDFKAFVEKVWNENLSGMYGGYLPYGRFYGEVYSIARFTAALASPTGGKSEKIMLYNLMKDFGESIHVSSHWGFLDFFLLPTYDEIRKRSMPDFPKFANLCKAADTFGKKILTQRTKVGRFFVRHAGSGLPKSDEDFRSLTTRLFSRKKKEILDRVLDDFNRFPLRAIAFITTIYNMKSQNDFRRWNRNEFVQAYTESHLGGLSIKAIGCFLQQGFGNVDTVPIDIWVKSFYKTVLGIKNNREFLVSFSEIGRFERFIWLCCQARKMNAEPFFDAMWCIKFGVPGRRVLRGPNPLSCSECTLRSKCVGYDELKDETIFVQRRRRRPAYNAHRDCKFVIGTEKDVPKTVFLRIGGGWKLVDEFSGYIIHKKTKHAGQKTKMTELAEELSS